MALTKVIGFLLGLAVGSFINVLVLREGKNINGRSYCPHCKHKLSWFDLVPLLSFFSLGRKCRYCSQKISWQYPLVELVSGLGYLLIFSLPLSATLTGWSLVLFSIGLLISVYDAKYLLIPNSFLATLAGWLVLGAVLFWRHTLVINFFSGVVLASFFLFILIASSGRWIGGGDVSLAFFLGFWVGWPNILIFLMATYLIGGVWAAGLLIYKKVSSKTQIAFGPFLWLGAFVAFFWGEQIIIWYLSFF